jgi:hypothetical protein
MMGAYSLAIFQARDSAPLDPKTIHATLRDAPLPLSGSNSICLHMEANPVLHKIVAQALESCL